MPETSTLTLPQDPPSARRSSRSATRPSTVTFAGLGFLLALCVVCLGWINREANPIIAGEGLGYALGIAGGVPMLLLLLYSLRKRFRFMRRLGATRYWFRIHMMLGVIGPVLILYHCNFRVGSLNSKVALYCTLLVAASGVVGRYLYARIHHGLYGRKASLAELIKQLTGASSQFSSREGFIDEIRDELVTLSRDVISPATTVWESVSRPIVFGLRTRWLYHRMNWTLRKKLIARSMESQAVEEHRERLIQVTRVFLQQNLSQIRKVAQFDACEHLFSWWHIIHVPFFLMMIFSAVVHVLAVHLY